LDLSGVYFEESTTTFREAESSISVLNIANPVTQILPNSTTYCYSFFDLSNITASQIIMEKAIVNNSLVHHMLGYLCDTIPKNLTDANTTRCVIDGQSSYISKCSRAYVLWGKGGITKVYPSEVGKPIGKTAHNTEYLLLETHYSNPDHLTNQTDYGSGMQLTITNQLRKYDSSVLMLGTHYDFISVRVWVPFTIMVHPRQLLINFHITLKTKIPPRKSNYSIASECPIKCTNNPKYGIPAGGITAIGYMSHMHNRGKEMYTQHIRGSTECKKTNKFKVYG
jgi:hypothetical protein